MPLWHKLIMKIGPLPDALELGFHRVGTHWIRGFMAFRLVRRTRAVLLMVSVCPESGFRDGAAQLRRLENRRALERMNAASTPV